MSLTRQRITESREQEFPAGTEEGQTCTWARINQRLVHGDYSPPKFLECLPGELVGSQAPLPELPSSSAGLKASWKVENTSNSLRHKQGRGPSATVALENIGRIETQAS